MIKFLKYFYTRLETQLEYTHTEGRPYWVLDYYKNSMLLFNADGETITSEPGSIYIIPPNTPTQHISANNRPWAHTTITFEAERGDMDEFALPYMTPIHITDVKELEQLMYDMESKQLSSSRLKQKAQEAYITLILLCVHDAVNKYNKDYKTNSGDDLQQVRHTVMSSTHIPWTIERMAALANMSARGFQRKYVQMYGKPPIADLQDYRFTKAKRLLDSGFSISFILNSCGFKSAQHFSNFFKQHAGMTPSEYRKRSVK